MNAIFESGFGRNIRVRISGGSHEDSILCHVKNFPISFQGEEFDMEKLAAFSALRSPGKPLTSPRREEDFPIFDEGIFDSNKLKCSDFSFSIKNKDFRIEEYHEFQHKPRPGHADYPANIKYKGNANLSGGGPFSGRMTAPICVLGGLALQLLEKRGIVVFSHISSIGDICDISAVDISFPVSSTIIPSNGEGAAVMKSSENELKINALMPLREDLLHSRLAFPLFDKSVEKKMKNLIEKVSANGDSIGGSIECVALNLPVGLGGPMYDGLESIISPLLFGIPGAKGVEFGRGFQLAKLLGSQANDPYYIESDRIYTATNNHGGILGGISTGMPLISRVAFKPTPSIAIPQDTVNLLTHENDHIKITGRHDPCIVLRAHPVVTSLVAFAILDCLTEA